MHYSVNQSTRDQACAPHELAMTNLLVFNLMLCGGVIASTMAQKGSVLDHYKLWTIVVPLGLSLAVIAYSFWRAARAKADGPWFAAAHWSLATSRYRFLLVAYLVGAALVGLAWLISLSNPKLQDLMFIALVRVAVAPMLISVMVLAVLESSALYQAGSGEVPDGVVKRIPPPTDMLGSDHPSLDLTTGHRKGAFKERNAMLSKLIVSSYALLLEISLWLSLVLFIVGGWNAPINPFSGERGGFIGAIIGLVMWFVVATVFFGAFLILEDIRRSVRNIESGKG